NRISQDFKVPADLQERTSFWFDIYTKYGSNEHVIHHVLYPWIVYKVVDTTEILSADQNKWVKYHKAEAEVKTQMREVRATLHKLAKRKSYVRLNPLEKDLFDALSVVKGRRQTVFRIAAQNVRV